jgi:hypothetical protein
LEEEIMKLKHYIAFFLLPICVSIGLSQDKSMHDRILNKDYAIAEKALDENTNKKDVEAICLSLKSKFTPLKLKAAKSLGSIGDSKAVDCLVEGLRESDSIFTYNTESQDYKNAYISSAVQSLRSITGLELKVKKTPTKVDPWKIDIEQIIGEVKTWQSNQKTKKR